MRRMWAAGAAIVVCLALGGVPAVAQSPSAPIAQAGPALVTGTQTCGFVATADATQVRIEGVRRDQAGLECVSKVSDPRVSGPVKGTWNLAAWEGDADAIYWGDMVITGPDGTWEGSFTGVDAYGLVKSGLGNVGLMQTLEGTGAYTGWTYIAHLAFDYSTMTVDGVIYQGPPPPWERLPVASPSPSTK